MRKRKKASQPGPREPFGALVRVGADGVDRHHRVRRRRATGTGGNSARRGRTPARGWGRRSAARRRTGSPSWRPAGRCTGSSRAAGLGGWPRRGDGGPPRRLPVRIRTRPASSAGKFSADNPSLRAAQRQRRALVGTRRAPDAQVDPARMTLERPNCSATTSGAWLGSITPPEPTRIVEVDGRHVRDQDRRRRTRNGRHVVVLGHPVPPVAQFLDAAGEFGRVLQCLGRVDTGGNGGKLQHGEGNAVHPWANRRRTTDHPGLWQSARAARGLRLTNSPLQRPGTRQAACSREHHQVVRPPTAPRRIGARSAGSGVGLAVRDDRQRVHAAAADGRLDRPARARNSRSTSGRVDSDGRAGRVDPGPPQDLVREQVADAGDRLLVEQARLDRRRAARTAPGTAAGVICGRPDRAPPAAG